MYCIYTRTHCKILSVLPFTRTYCRNVIQTKLCSLLGFFRKGFTTRSIQGWNNNLISTVYINHNLISTSFQRCINVEITTSLYNFLIQPYFNVDAWLLIQRCCVCCDIYTWLYIVLMFKAQNCLGQFPTFTIP